MDSGGFIAPTFGQRLGGRLVDALVLLPIAFGFAAVAGTAGRVITVAIACAYEVAFVATTGRSLGKMAVGTRVVQAETGATVPVRDAIMRYAVLFGPGVVLSFLGLGVAGLVWTLVIIVMVLRPPLHRGPHDLAARTIVVPTRVVTPR